jgi:phage FluMu gp28-like protein
MVWLAEQAMAGKAGRNYWWVAPIYPQAKIAFRRLRRGLPAEVYTANEAELTLTLANGAIIWFKGADKADSLYGEDVYAAVIDEATRCKEDAWHAVRSTLTATRGPVRIIGNVKGRKNWAYMLARRAEAGEPGYRYTKITAQDAVAAGVLDAAEIEDARRDLPANVFRELYLAEPSDDGGNPFGVEAIGACVAPLSRAEAVAWGIDLAKSTDWTVLVGLDASGAVCRFERWQAPWETTITRVATVCGNVPALVDSTGVGDPVLEALQKRGGRYEGYKFTAQSKQQLMEGLAVAIQQAQVQYPDAPCPLRAELEAFEYIYSRTGVHYSAPEGMHDDCVCALALAVQRAKTGGRPGVWFL